MSDCPRLGNWIRGCNFEPRYDLSAPHGCDDLKGAAGGIAIVMEASKAKTYVRDVCTTCGAVRERAK